MRQQPRNRGRGTRQDLQNVLQVPRSSGVLAPAETPVPTGVPEFQDIKYAQPKIQKWGGEPVHIFRIPRRTEELHLHRDFLTDVPIAIIGLHKDGPNVRLSTADIKRIYDIFGWDLDTLRPRSATLQPKRVWSTNVVGKDVSTNTHFVTIQPTPQGGAFLGRSTYESIIDNDDRERWKVELTSRVLHSFLTDLGALHNTGNLLDPAQYGKPKNESLPPTAPVNSLSHHLQRPRRQT